MRCGGRHDTGFLVAGLHADGLNADAPMHCVLSACHPFAKRPISRGCAMPFLTQGTGRDEIISKVNQPLLIV